MQQLIIDWELSKKLAGNNLNNAREFLLLLINDLPQILQEIKISYQNKSFKIIEDKLHYLLGALNYCSAPRLKNKAAKLHQAIKRKQDIGTLLSEFEHEIALLIQAM